MQISVGCVHVHESCLLPNGLPITARKKVSLACTQNIEEAASKIIPRP